jgi:superoxide reductase
VQKFDKLIIFDKLSYSRKNIKMEDFIMDKKFYICEHCGNLVELIHSSGVQMVCCGSKMTLLEPATTDGSYEKHVPIVSVIGNTVTIEVGASAHPMIPDHFIQWIYLETDKGCHRKHLIPGEVAIATFTLNEETPIAAYEYCNIHGLWKKEI